jgi:hypothetical protein
MQTRLEINKWKNEESHIHPASTKFQPTKPNPQLVLHNALLEVKYETELTAFLQRKMKKMQINKAFQQKHQIERSVK